MLHYMLSLYMVHCIAQMRHFLTQSTILRNCPNVLHSFIKIHLHEKKSCVLKYSRGSYKVRKQPGFVLVFLIYFCLCQHSTLHAHIRNAVGQVQGLWSWWKHVTVTYFKVENDKGQPQSIGYRSRSSHAQLAVLPYTPPPPRGEYASLMGYDTQCVAVSMLHIRPNR